MKALRLLVGCEMHLNVPLILSVHCHVTYSCFAYVVNMFDYSSAAVIYEMCAEEPLATVQNVRNQEKLKYPSYPLSTIELQKRASRYFRMSSEHTMKVAEELYQARFISYPRTETDNFSLNTDLHTIVRVYVNKWLIQIGEHMLSDFWILKDYGETPAMVVMMTRHILLFIQQNFRLVNPIGPIIIKNCMSFLFAISLLAAPNQQLELKHCGN